MHECCNPPCPVPASLPRVLKTPPPPYSILFPPLQGSLSLPQVLLCDALFTGGAVAFLVAGLSYGLRWHPGSAAYKGAW